jgi:hypothetical protein
MTTRVDRPISDREIEVVTWLLENGSTEGPLRKLLEGLGQLRVVGRCGCGCASVDFERDGQSVLSHPIAEAIAETPAAGLKCGLILWGRDDAVTGLEIYEFEGGSLSELPPLEMLRPWDAAWQPRVALTSSDVSVT